MRISKKHLALRPPVVLPVKEKSASILLITAGQILNRGLNLTPIGHVRSIKKAAAYKSSGHRRRGA
jgi:hypothetical protein